MSDAPPNAVHDPVIGPTPNPVRYRVTGMDCAHDAAEIEQAARGVAGVETVRVSVASQILTARVADSGVLPSVERAVAGLGYQLNRLDPPDRAPGGAARPASPGGDADGDPDDLPKDLSHITPGYRRALWIVVLLNVGYGVVEAVGGFLSGSQALKADALDFLGDGLITFLGLLAIRWSLRARARSALIQGLFLGALGLGVLVSTAYRVLMQQQPEAELMGVFGGFALVVNVAAALVLIPHRTGDANARAVWLFSRNDAIGNVAVVVAAGLVAWTGSAWPDLVVAVVIAGLFLQSSWAIVRDARADLREAVEHGARA
ncbi:MAG: cation diffusion facilitator family transporter [Gemmatimonadaceae bacterium]|jgi:copper chaperone CopZ|nr:cation diffusion facilitator family transporter [Gemmatimonadaceae bacterium]